ncbi:MAG TPA: patatin-like phospholipase family protein, partial [Patescibacteria group bacterium]|nr:patatin-like phospholipase family protein [Patescibacteria group bacterium]
MSNTKPKIGLALGGGGPRGLAHIGVLKKLAEYEISVDLVAGTSIGAEIGGLYALTKDIERIENFATGTNWKKLFEVFAKPSLFSGGLINTDGIESFIEKEFERKSFSDLQLPFRAVAVDINTGRQVD